VKYFFNQPQQRLSMVIVEPHLCSLTITQTKPIQNSARQDQHKKKPYKYSTKQLEKTLSFIQFRQTFIFSDEVSLVWFSKELSRTMRLEIEKMLVRGLTDRLRITKQSLKEEMRRMTRVLVTFMTHLPVFLMSSRIPATLRGSPTLRLAHKHRLNLI
jgi:hypothetical protein